MRPPRPALHSRTLPGICSREVTTWRGAPLRGIYFVENTLPEDLRAATDRGPVLLVPGSWDPKQGEFSDNLIRALLQESGAPSVLELHYRYDGEDGYVDPGALVDDLVNIYLDREAPPTVVGLCFSCPFLLEALLIARERDPSPPVAGVLAIGLGVPGFLNAIGRTALRSHIHMKVGAEARHLSYTGHPHVAGNNARGEAWISQSRLKAAMLALDPEGPVLPFPVPVETLYFQLDVSTRTGRALVRRLFGIVETGASLPGYHRSLRRRSPADARIMEFYGRTQCAAVGRGGATP